jgi:hypothetical protein
MSARISFKLCPVTPGAAGVLRILAHWGQPAPMAVVVWTAPVTPPVSIAIGRGIGTGIAVEGM